MPWWFQETDVFESPMPGRFCCDCFEFQPLINFSVLRHGWQGRHSRCIVCNIWNSKLLRKMKKEHPPPADGMCKGCGSTEKKLSCDHCHESNCFRAWLCTSCNLKNRRPWRRVARSHGSLPTRESQSTRRFTRGSQGLGRMDTEKENHYK